MLNERPTKIRVKHKNQPLGLLSCHNLFTAEHQSKGQLTYIGYFSTFELSTFSSALFMKRFIAFILLCDSFTGVTSPLV